MAKKKNTLEENNSGKNDIFEEKESNREEDITLDEFCEKILNEAGRYPQFAGKFVLSEVAPTNTLGTINRKCIRWGRDPVTGKRICVEWE